MLNSSNQKIKVCKKISGKSLFKKSERTASNGKSRFFLFEVYITTPTDNEITHRYEASFIPILYNFSGHPMPFTTIQ